MPAGTPALLFVLRCEFARSEGIDMRLDTIIRGGTIVTASDTYKSDVGITGDKIVAIAQELNPENATRMIDATGHYVMPGGIDVHTHLDMPFRRHHQRG